MRNPTICSSFGSTVADNLALWANSRGDITHVQVDAIVNAANTGLLGAPLILYWFWTAYSFPVSVPNNSTTIEFLELKIMRSARYRWRWRCVSDTVIAAPHVQEPCLPTESIGQWTEPYTGRRDPSSSKNVRLRTSHTSLLRLRVDHGPKNLSGRTLGGCPTGEARITSGYNLPA